MIERKKIIKQQAALADAKEAKEVAMTGRSMTEAAVQKRKEREEKQARKLAFAAETATSGTSPDPISARSGISPPQGDERSVSPESSVRDTVTSHVHPHTVVVPTTSSSFEWYRPHGNTYLPSLPQEQLEYGITLQHCMKEQDVVRGRGLDNV